MSRGEPSRSCQKRNYWSFEDAKGRIDELRATKKKRIPHRTYKCERCPFWHITSQWRTEEG